MFVFGDSLFDAGNNNYINTTYDFKANFRPYGETYSPPTLLAANFANKPFVKPYLAMKKLNGLFINGVNFASAGAGSLDGTNAGLVISFKAQLGYFKKVSQQLKQEVGSDGSKRLLSNAVYMFSIGSNDYSTFITSSTLLNTYTQNQYVDMVVGAIGCVPSARAANFQAGSCECLEILQTLAKLHNEALQKMLNNLATNLPGFKYSYFDYFQSAIDTISNPSTYGGRSAECADNAPVVGNDDNADTEDEDGGEPNVQQEQGGPSTQQGGPTMMDWESTRAFHLQLHQDQMAYLQAHMEMVIGADEDSTVAAMVV
nr:GDSL esterase/lipase 1-like [Ipomoea batatas]